MKTKIIYISGGEVFAPSDVRTAFDEVRRMLNMPADTVFFGVPVDSDDVGAGAHADAIDSVSETPLSFGDIPTPAAAETPDIGTRKTKRSRPKKEPIAASAENPSVADGTPETAIPGPTAEIGTLDGGVAETVPTESAPKRSAPILSVLGIVKPIAAAQESVVERTVSAEIKTTCDADACVTTETRTTEIKQVEQTVARTEPLDRAPTIEDIFAELEPLKEEKIVDFGLSDSDDAPEEPSNDLETDATLAKMAVEFAAAQDNIPAEPIAKHGKIGKLKNILPFKKIKKEEPSALDDLFGWAGIAANDDDEKFTVPSWALGNN
jgi:hypothetical protein